MPRGRNPKSLQNLKKGKRFSSADDSARENAKKSAQLRRNIADQMKALLEEPNKDGSTRKKALAAKLVLNMQKSPEWYKLGLRMIGELPAENVNINVPDNNIMDEIRKRMEESNEP